MYFFVMFICNCFCIISRWTSWDFGNYTVVQLNYCVNNFITNQINSFFSCFLNYSLLSRFKCICSRLFSKIKQFLSIFNTKVFNYIFTHIFTQKKKKNKNPFTNIVYLCWYIKYNVSLGWTEQRTFHTLLITKVILFYLLSLAVWNFDQ